MRSPRPSHAAAHARGSRRTQDVTTSDDCIGQAEVRLAAGATSGEQQSVEMIDPTGKHAPFQMAFEWELRDEVPPASILVLSDMKVLSARAACDASLLPFSLCQPDSTDRGPTDIATHPCLSAHRRSATG
jgi:hypothetical protein